MDTGCAKESGTTREPVSLATIARPATPERYPTAPMARVEVFREVIMATGGTR